MTYEQTLDWLFNQLPMYQNQGAKAYKKDLSNTTLLMDYLGNPEKEVKAIHVAGTNGKGSTCHMLASVLQEQGYNIGLYTSPHLIDFRERIKVNGQEIPKEYVVAFIARHKVFFETNALSFFEMTVGLCFEYFKDIKVDYVVLETGLGGRLDSTNVIDPLLSVITNIGLDHVEFLGNTLTAIAKEKAGIIKENRPVVVGEYNIDTIDVFKETARSKSAPVYCGFELGQIDYECDLKGNYQKHNIKTVLKTVEVLNSIGVKVTHESLLKGLKGVVKNTGLLGRYQIIQDQPKVILDTAHNKEGVSLVVNQLLQEEFNQLHIVFGLVNDKDLDTVLSLLPKKAIYYFTRPAVSRGMPEQKLKVEAEKYKLKGISFSTVKLAVNQAILSTSTKDLIYVGGSTFVVADYLKTFS